MKKILMSVMVIAVAVAVVAGGSMAYFSNTETSTDNVFQAGTIDLAVNSENPWVSAAFAFIDVKPSQDLDPFKIKFENVGNNEGILYTCFDYVANDKQGVSADVFYPNLSADQFAAIVYVEAVEYQYTCPADSYVGSWQDDLTNWLGMDANSDGKVSLYEMKAASPIPYDLSGDPFLATATIEWEITFHLADALADWNVLSSAIQTGVEDNAPQADGIDGKVSGILLQVGAPTPPTCP